MKPLVSITGHIATFYQLMKCDQDWAMSNGVSEASARKFTSSFYSSLAQGADSCTDSFEQLIDHASTPGGLNAQSLTHLKGTEHYPLQAESLQLILNRLLGK